MGVHASHPDIVLRLRRAEGHLRVVVTMIEEGRSCLDIAQQLQAVEAAITNAKKALIHDHMDHCLHHAHGKEGDVMDSLVEIKAITRYL